MSDNQEEIIDLEVSELALVSGGSAANTSGFGSTVGLNRSIHVIDGNGGLA